jgi:hypothetical protein
MLYNLGCFKPSGGFVVESLNRVSGPTSVVSGVDTAVSSRTITAESVW